MEIGFGFIVDKPTLEKLEEKNFTLQNIDLISRIWVDRRKYISEPGSRKITFERNKVLAKLYQDFLNEPQPYISNIKIFIQEYLYTEKLFRYAIENSGPFSEMYGFYIQNQMTILRNLLEGVYSEENLIDQIEILYFRETPSSFARAEILVEQVQEVFKILQENTTSEARLVELKSYMEEFSLSEEFQKLLNYQSQTKNMVCDLLQKSSVLFFGEEKER